MAGLLELVLYGAMLFFGVQLWGQDFLWIVAVVFGIVAVMAAVFMLIRRRWWNNLTPAQQRQRLRRGGRGEDRWFYVWCRLTASDNVIWLGLLFLTCVVSIYALQNGGPSPYEYAMRDQPVAKAYVERSTDRMESVRNYAMGGNFAPNSVSSGEPEKVPAKNWNWWAIAAYLWFWTFVLFFPTLGDEVRTTFWSSLQKVAAGLDANAKVVGPAAGFLNGLLQRARRVAPTAAGGAAVTAAGATTAAASTASATGSTINAVHFASSLLANMVTDLPHMIMNWFLRA